jgi:hypothetical protein
MNERKLKALKLRVVKLFASWKEPHEETTYNQSDIVQSIDVSDQGQVDYTIAPKHPHCPCCLLDAVDLRKRIESIKASAELFVLLLGYLPLKSGPRSVNG